MAMGCKHIKYALKEFLMKKPELLNWLQEEVQQWEAFPAQVAQTAHGSIRL